MEMLAFAIAVVVVAALGLGLGLAVAPRLAAWEDRRADADAPDGPEVAGADGYDAGRTGEADQNAGGDDGD